MLEKACKGVGVTPQTQTQMEEWFFPPLDFALASVLFNLMTLIYYVLVAHFLIVAMYTYLQLFLFFFSGVFFKGK